MLKKIYSYRYPLLIGAIALILFYFFFPKTERGRLARGLLTNPEMYDSVEVFLPLDSADMVLPEGVSLERYCPRPRNQGDQNSCVGWSVAYAARTIIAAQATGQSPNSVAFSPAFLFNQISFNQCQGAYIANAFDKMCKVGIVGFNDFPYRDGECQKLPTPELLALAKNFRIAGYSRLTKSKTDYSIDTALIKQSLVQGTPVIIGALVTPSFEDLTEKVWHPEANEEVLGGHAMCVVGYNNAVEGGAFRVLNSWGTNWADNGFVWIRYADFVQYCKEAYVIQPLPFQSKEHQFALEMTWMNSEKQPMALSKKANVFVPEVGATAPQAETMQLRIDNKSKEYFYLISQHEGKPSTVVFPAKKGESAYLGLCGKRSFAVPHSIADGEIAGLQSVVAIISKTPLCIDSLCMKINANMHNTLHGNLQKILQLSIDPKARMSMQQNTISLQTDSSAYSVVLLPFVLPNAASKTTSLAPTFQDALKNPIDSLVLKFANVKTTPKSISFDITANTSKHTAWNGYFNQVEVGVEYDPKVIGKTVAQEAVQSLAPELIKANYRLIVDYLPTGKLILKINPKSNQRESFSRKPRVIAHLTLPVGLCDGKSTFLRLSSNGKNSVATYSLASNVPEKGNLSLSYKHINLRETVVPLKCK